MLRNVYKSLDKGESIPTQRERDEKFAIPTAKEEGIRIE